MAWAGDVVTSMLSATFAGTRMLFGELGLPNSGAFGKLIAPNSGAIFAFQVLPTIIFISAFFAVMYHIGLMQIIIRGMAWVMLKTMRISGAESMNVAASIFMGQTEAPLTIRPFLSKATRSELMTIMTSGMAHVSGGIMAMYISQGVEATPSPVRRDHDLAGNHPHGQDAGARNRSPRHRGQASSSPKTSSTRTRTSSAPSPAAPSTAASWP